MPQGRSALRVEGVRKCYGATVALARVDLDIQAGEIHGLFGDNGAGKSTLARIIAGIDHPDDGHVTVLGRELPRRFGPAQAAAAGLGFIHQDLGLVDELSVAENIALVCGYPRRRGLIDRRRLRSMAERSLSRIGLAVNVDRDVAEFPIAVKSLIAISRVLSTGARILVLDEPTVRLPPPQIAVVARALRSLRDSGITCVLITHRSDEVTALCDRVTVLRDGRNVATGPRQVVAVQRAAAQRNIVKGEKRLDVIGLRVGDLGPVDISVRAGEILAVVGGPEADLTAIGDFLFGVRQGRCVSASISGRDYRPRDPRHAISRGIAYVPSDRQGAATLDSLTVADNLLAESLAVSWTPTRPRTEGRTISAVLREFAVAPPDPAKVMSTLSGGNQQKVVIARQLRDVPDVLVIHDPTASVDAGTRASLHARLLAASHERGCAVLLTSSDPDEVFRIADRVVVLTQRTIAAEIERADLTHADLTAILNGEPV